MATDQTYRIGIIGCGGMGRSHSRSWQKQPNAEIVAAMDIYEESVKRIASSMSVRVVPKLLWDGSMGSNYMSSSMTKVNCCPLWWHGET